MKSTKILEAFQAARKERVAFNTDPSKPSWVEVEAVFNGNVSKRLTVLDDGSDVVSSVEWAAAHLQKRHPSYTFHFDGFVKP